MLMPKGEVLSSSPATQSTPPILVPSSKLLRTYLAENPANNYLYQILGQLARFSGAFELPANGKDGSTAWMMKKRKSVLADGYA